MKKALFLVIAIIGFSYAAYADTVVIVSDATVNGAKVSSQDVSAFAGTQTITIEVAGKTCSLKGSARGSVPMGCNYTLTVAEGGSISGVLRAGNQVCTQTREIANSCK